MPTMNSNKKKPSISSPILQTQFRPISKTPIFTNSHNLLQLRLTSHHIKMKLNRNLRIIIALLIPFISILLIATIYYFYMRTKRALISQKSNFEAQNRGDLECVEAEEEEELMVFSGGEDFQIEDILNAPGEVVAKSCYGTFYRASIKRNVEGDGSAIMLLRFIRPVCIGRTGEIRAAVRGIGMVRHENLVPLRSLYVGARGEKLFVYPFYAAGNLAQFLKGESPSESKLSTKWEIIYNISLGIARGLNHLHNGLQKPLIHGNLKSKNIMLDHDFRPLLSDFGLHLLLRPAAAQQAFESLTVEGYKAPELIKMREASVETDIYSLGIVLLEMLTRKDSTNCRLLVLNQKMSDVFSSELVSERRDERENLEGVLRRFYQLAMVCCSPSPALRPDVREVIRKLEEIG